MCKCIDLKRRDIMDHTPSVKWLRFDLDNCRVLDKNGESIGGNRTGQRIEYKIEVKKKDGTVKDKIEKSFIVHVYCPFCGKKYK